MSAETLAESAPQAGSRRTPSLRLRLGLGVLLLTGLIVGLVEWGLDGHAPRDAGLARTGLLVLLISATQLLLIEALLLRPLRRLAAGCEALESVPAPLTSEADLPAPGLAAELDRIGHAMRRVRDSLWQQDQDARELRRELAQQQLLLEQAQSALQAQQRELAGLARTDALTGIANARAFDEALRREFKRAQRQQPALAVLDLDQFKQFNLVHGTAAGDAALQRVASLLSERFKRDTDVVARLGGEEFVALLPGFGMAEAQGVLELLRDELRAQRLPDGTTETPLTISVGLAAASPAHPYLSAQALMQAADEALYIAKHAGRDRLSLAA